MPAPDPSTFPRHERRSPSWPARWAGWGWPALGIVGGSLVAWAVHLPLAKLPLVGSVSYAGDNAVRARAVLVCAVAAALGCAVRWFRPALLCSGIIAGLLAASTLEKLKDLQAMEANTRVPPGAGEMTRQYASMSAQTLAASHPLAGAYLLPAGCLLGIVAAVAGSRRAARTTGNQGRGPTVNPSAPAGFPPDRA